MAMAAMPHLIVSSACWTWPSHESDIDGPRHITSCAARRRQVVAEACDEKEAVDKRQRVAIAASGLAYMGNPVLKAETANPNCPYAGPSRDQAAGRHL